MSDCHRRECRKLAQQYAQLKRQFSAQERIVRDDKLEDQRYMNKLDAENKKLRNERDELEARLRSFQEKEDDYESAQACTSELANMCNQKDDVIHGLEKEKEDLLVQIHQLEQRVNNATTETATFSENNTRTSLPPCNSAINQANLNINYLQDAVSTQDNFDRLKALEDQLEAEQLVNEQLESFNKTLLAEKNELAARVAQLEDPGLSDGTIHIKHEKLAGPRQEELQLYARVTVLEEKLLKVKQEHAAKNKQFIALGERMKEQSNQNTAQIRQLYAENQQLRALLAQVVQQQGNTLVEQPHIEGPLPSTS